MGRVYHIITPKMYYPSKNKYGDMNICNNTKSRYNWDAMKTLIFLKVFMPSKLYIPQGKIKNIFQGEYIITITTT